MKENEVYNAFPGVRQFQERRIPFAIVSNSWKKRSQLMLQLRNVKSAIYPDLWATHFAGYTDENKRLAEKYQESLHYRFDGTSWRYSNRNLLNVFSAPRQTNTNDQQEFSCAKPSEAGVLNAKDWLRENFGLHEQARIIGVGNTPEDIIAYHAARHRSRFVFMGST